MLAARYLLTYWAAAIESAVVYQLLNRLPGMIYACRIALLPLVFHILPVSWQWSFREKKATDWQILIHRAAVAHLLIALGSITSYYDIGNDGQIPAVLIHALFAFTAVGTLESLRQNRNDIQPRSLGLFYGYGMRYDLNEIDDRLPGSTFRDAARVFGAKAVIVIVTIGLQSCVAYGILRLADWHWGTSLSKAIPILHDDYQVKGRLGSALLTMFLLTPILDMAETLFYLLLWKFVKNRPGWARKPERLIEDLDLFKPVEDPLAIVISIWCWVPPVFLMWLVQFCLHRWPQLSQYL